MFVQKFTDWAKVPPSVRYLGKTTDTCNPRENTGNALTLRLTEPYNDSMGAPINLAHKLDLLVALFQSFLGLVDADGVNPEDTRASLAPQHYQRIVTIWRYEETSAVAEDRYGSDGRSPDVGERLVGECQWLCARPAGASRSRRLGTVKIHEFNLAADRRAALSGGEEFEYPDRTGRWQRFVFVGWDVRVRVHLRLLKKKGAKMVTPSNAYTRVLVKGTGDGNGGIPGGKCEEDAEMRW